MGKSKLSKEMAMELGIISSGLSGKSALAGAILRLREEYPQLSLNECKKLAKKYLEDRK